MRLIASMILAGKLAGGCASTPPAGPVAAVCNPDLPLEPLAGTWDWLDANDPLLSRGIDRANARELCTCPRKRAELSAEDAAAICGGAP